YPSAQQTSATNNLIYHGGLVETTPAVYLVYWGPTWQSGFSFSHGGYTYTNKTVETYVNSFFGNVGGSSWAGVQTQYCQNADPLITSCTGQPYAQYVTNPTSQLKGVWVDPSSVPSDIVTTGLVENQTNDPLEAEAIKAAQHFGYDVNATYFILTQPGTQATAYGSVYCAYHSETAHTTGHGVRYAFVPYVPDQGAGCGMDAVNPDDAFGHGYLDGYSIVAGHEYAEAVTDPDNQMGTQDGWNDATTSENGDKCAWTSLQNIALGKKGYFAVQPLWSNEANGGQGACAVSR
ncbi:MAG TPA: hypothetical protein VF898_12445, partial [Chloroflexota bacterium]